METPPRKAHPSPKKPGICMKCSRSFNATTGHRLCLICREQEKPKRDIQFRKWVPCGKCKACMTTVDCGACAGCRKAEGNPGKTVRCRKRKCLCPIRKTPFRHEVEQASLAFSVDVLTDYRVSGSSLVRRPGDRKKTLPSQGSDSDEYRPPYEDTDEDEEEEGEQEEEEEEEEEEGEDEDGEALRRKRRTCGKCKGCVLQRDCGTCDFCFDKPKFGGSNKKRQKCRLRQCTRQAMRHLLPGEGKKGRGRRREPWEFEFSDNEGDGRSGSRPVKVQKTYSRQLQTTVQPLQPLTPIMVNAPILNTQQVVAVSGVSIRQNSSTSQILTTALPIAGRPVATVWAPLVVQSHQRAPEPQTQVQPQPQPPPQVQVQVLAQPPPQPLPQRQVLAQVQPQPQPQPQRQTQVLVQTPPQRQPQLLVQTQTQRPPQPQAVTESRVARSWSSAAAMETANDSRVGRSWNSATMETANGSSRHSVEETQLSNGDAGGGVEEEEDGVPTITGIFSLAGAGGRGVELDSELMSLLDGVRGECLPALWLCVLGAGSGSGPELRLLQCSKTSTMSDTCVTIGNGLNYYSIHVQQHPLVPTHPLYTQHGARMSTPQQVVALLRDLEGHAVCQGIRSAPPPNEPFISVRAATCLFLIPRSRTRCGECRYPSENK